MAKSPAKAAKPVHRRSRASARSDRQRFREPHGFPGKLIVVEGIDGSGKTTQLRLLSHWLSAGDREVVHTEWSSSQLIAGVRQLSQRAMQLTPTTYSLLHATDFAHRQIYDIIPPLKAGMVVLADRYVYTAFARDVARGVDRDWVRDVYRFAVKPDLVIYLKLSIETVLRRVLVNHRTIAPYEAGMDLNLSSDKIESYRIFQSRLIREFNLMSEEFHFATLDGNLGISELQGKIREAVGGPVV